MNLCHRKNLYFPQQLSPASAAPDSDWEFPRHQLRFVSLVGEGCFGQVWKYEADGIVKGEEGEEANRRVIGMGREIFLYRGTRPSCRNSNSLF